MTSDDFGRSVERTYPRWSRAAGRVTKVRHFGAFVEFDDGVEGIVRRRELSWEGDVAPKEVLSPGQTIDVVVVDIDHENRRLELSRRLVEYDPWQDFIAAYQPGHVISGRVIRVMPYGAFVEIAPGVVGLVHIAEIAPWFVEQVEDVLWVGDQVRAAILNIDPAKRHVALSIKKHLKHLEREATQAVIAEYTAREPGGHMSLGEQLGLSADQLKRQLWGETDEAEGTTQRGKILVVDDEESLADLLEDWLYALGYEVDSAYSGEAGLESALMGDYDVILMDLNLPNMDGLEATRRILAKQPTSRVVLITGASLADEYNADIQAIGFAAVLLKPFTSQEIKTLLERLQCGDEPDAGDDALHSPDLAEEVGFFERVSRVVEGRGALAQALTQALDEVLAESQATAGAVFDMDPVTETVTLTAQTGQALDFEGSRHHLSDSPIKDVILERQVVLENDAAGKGRGRFRHLLPLLDFQSCIGVPIKAQDDVRHGLFLFHRQADHFAPHHLGRTLAVSVLMGAAIERRILERMMRSFQRLVLVGQLSSGLAHEVNNKLASVELHTQNLLRGFERLAREQSELADTFLYRDLNRTAETIADMNQEVLKTARMFQTLIKGEEPRMVNVNDVISRTLRLLDPLAHKHQVTLKSHLAGDVPRTMAVGVRLQQALHNVVLNAVQQIDAQRDGGGRIEVSSRHVPDDPHYPIKIYVADDGPGIHRQHFDQVFAMGFTTRREQGTGLGLYITRGLLESMGGRIRIAESVMLVGTTFLIELPLIAKEKLDA